MQDSSCEDNSNKIKEKFIERFVEAFQVLDRNQDGALSKTEIDQAVIDLSLEPKLAEIVAVLKSEFDEIKDLHKKEKNAGKDVVTSSDVIALARILLDNADELSVSENDLGSLFRRQKEKVNNNPVLLSSVAHSLMQHIRTTANSALSLYKNKEDPIEGINLDAIQQGRVGNCIFLAALGSVVATMPQLVAFMIKDNGDNTYTVTFPGARTEPVTVERPTIIELALYTQVTEWGFWPAVIEKAFGVYMKEMSWAPKLIPAENTSCPEYWSEVFKLLTGQQGRIEDLKENTREKVTTILTKAFREKRAVTAWSIDSTIKVTPRTGIHTNHAYSVIDWDPKLLRITLRNPWGAAASSEPETEEGEPLDGFLEGIFTLDFDDFLASFDTIHCEEWTSAETSDVPSELNAVHDKLELAQNIKVHDIDWFDRFAPSIVSRVAAGLALVFVGLVLMWLPIDWLSYTYLSMSWPMTSGKIEKVDRSIELVQSIGSFSDLGVLYTYQVSGHTYRSSVVGGMADILIGSADLLIKQNYPPEKVVSVYYNPQNPDQACLRRGFQLFKSIILIFWILGALAVVITGVAFMLDRRFFTSWRKAGDEARRSWRQIT